MKRLCIILLIFFLCITMYAGEKPIISVLDFYTEEGISRSEMRLFISLLSSALFQTKLYVVIDVSERETLLSELEFSVSDCSDESCQLEIGRLLSAEAIIIGRIGRLGSRYVLSIKMLETDTGRAINTADGVYESIDFMVDDVGTIAENLASVHRERAEAEEEIVEEEIITPEEETVEEETMEEEITEETVIEDEEEVAEIIEEEPPSPGPGTLGIFSMSLEAGVKFPFGSLQDLFYMSGMALIMADLNLNLGREKIGFGIVTGIDLEKINGDAYLIQFPYRLTAIPLGGHLQYETGFMLPLFLHIEMMGGLFLGLVEYFNDIIEMEDEKIIRPFSGLGGGLGFAITKSIRVAAGASLFVLFFTNDPLLGIFPYARVEMHF
jgi:hypothetical protein